MRAIDIMRTVARWHGIEWEVFCNSSLRWREVYMARREAFWLARKNTSASLTMIGRAIRVDHTSVFHGCQRFQDMIDSGEAADRSSLLMSGETPANPVYYKPVSDSRMKWRARTGRVHKESQVTERKKVSWLPPEMQRGRHV